MKLLFSWFLILFCFTAMAETDLRFTLTDAQFGLSQTTNCTVLLQAQNVQQRGSITLLPFRLSQVTDINGITTFSNLFGGSVNGFYHWTITVPGTTKRVDGDVWISSTNLGVVSEGIVDVVNGAPSNPSGTWAWSAPASDLRYALSTNEQLSFITIGQLNSASNTLALGNIASTNGMTSIVYSNPVAYTTPTQVTNIVNAIAVTTGVPINATNQFATTNTVMFQSNAITAAFQVTNVTTIAALNTASNLLVFSKQPASTILTNLSNTGAWTNQLTAGQNATLTTNLGVVTINATNQTFLTNGLLATIPISATNQFSTTNQVFAGDAANLVFATAISNQFQFSKQPASGILTNLSTSGAFTNVIVMGTNITSITNGGVVTLNVPTPSFLTNGFVDKSITNGFISASSLSYLYTATNIFNSYTNYLENGVFTNTYLMVSNLSLTSWNGVYSFWRMTNDMAIYTNSPFGTAFLFCGNKISTYTCSVFQTTADYDRFNALGVWHFDNFVGSGLPPSSLWEVSQDQPSIEFMDVLAPGIIMSLNAQIINFGGITTLTNSRYLDYISNPYKITFGAGEIIALAYTSNGIPLASIGQDSTAPDLDGTITTWGNASTATMGNAGRFVGNVWPWQLSSPGSDTRSLILKGEYATAGPNSGGTAMLEARAFNDGKPYHGTFNNGFKITTNGLTLIGNLSDLADNGLNTIKPFFWASVLGDGSSYSTKTNGSYFPAFGIYSQRLTTNAIPGAIEYDSTNWFYTDANSNRHIAFMDFNGALLTNLQFSGFTNLGTSAHSNAIAFITPVQLAGSNFYTSIPASTTNLYYPTSNPSAFISTIPVAATNLFLVANATNDLNTQLHALVTIATNTDQQIATNLFNSAIAASVLSNAVDRISLTNFSQNITGLGASNDVITASNTLTVNLNSASNSIVTGIGSVSTSGLMSNNIAGKGTNNTFAFSTLNSVSMTGARLFASNNVIMLQTPNGDISFDPSCVITIGAGQVGCGIIGSLNAENAGSFSTIISGGTASGPAGVGIASGVSYATSINASLGATNWKSGTLIIGAKANAFNLNSIVISDNHQNSMWWDTTNNMMTINELNGVSIGTTNSNFGYQLTVNGLVWATGFSIGGLPSLLATPFTTNTPTVVSNMIAQPILAFSNTVYSTRGAISNVVSSVWTTNSPSVVTGIVQNIASVVLGAQGLTADNAYTNIAIAKASVNTLLTNVIKMNFTNPVYGTLASFIWSPTQNVFTNSLNGLFITNNLTSGNYLLNTPALSALFSLPNTTLIQGASWTAVNGVGTCFSGYAASWDTLTSGVIVTNLNFNSFDTTTASLLNSASIGHKIIQTNWISGATYNNSYGIPITVSGTAGLTTAAGVAGAANLSLRCDALPLNGGWTNIYAVQTTALSLALNYTNYISLEIPTNANWTFTNISAGSGDSSTVLGGQIKY